ncbi:FecR family protein [Dyadobacter sp. CY323]|uniref:FecR family protein n=1 Tax=Dyadobacter sp. CY323 TaxID=2907302 RepID=UPI001F3F1FD4|nr:FecR family protein [Dyadobacter sp. CY323]MCE6989931.1 FecR domain-containing protein [Dyadobacter sp. CY323]
MINYRAHTVEELATDEMFRRWVMDPTPKLASFWKQWTDENPDRLHIVAQAREMVLAVHDIYKDELSDEMVGHEIREIVRLAELRPEPEQRNIFYWPAFRRIAAVVTLVSGLGLLYYASESSLPLAGTKPQDEQTEELMFSKTNTTQEEMIVLLSDNSVATLSKGSKITFPKHFGTKERRVYLTGEAFFDVTKNPAQPFLVYANETVTKVLGTSFRVKAFEEDNTVLVVVKTGRVSVFPKHEYEVKPGEKIEKTIGVILNPNQQAVFLRKENRLEKGVVMQPALLSESVVRKDQIFDERPVSEVFQSLEKMYGITIIHNAETLLNCMISAQFVDENLKQRMNAICGAIGASYDMIDGQIVISSKGCN